MSGYDEWSNPYADVPKRMRDLNDWLPSVTVIKRALAGHELFGLKDQPMTPRHKVFIALAYAYADGRVNEGEGNVPETRQEVYDCLDMEAAFGKDPS